VDLCYRVIAAISQRLELGEVKICPVEVNSSSRLALLEQGLIDIECGSTTNTAQRQQFSLFSHSVFYTAHCILLKNANVAGRVSPQQALTITGIENSTSHSSLMAWRHPDWRFHFVGCDTISSTFERFREDIQVDAMVADEVILKSLLLRSEMTDVTLLPDTLGGEPYGFMIRKGDHSFKAEVDTQLAVAFQSDDLEALYARWFMKALPGLDFNLNMPMTEPMRDLIQSPNDRAS
jgi:glutamate/aspartate transport system substrate-binding protein